MIKRRDFLINSGLALGALAIAPSFAFTTKKRPIGIQLWTLRDTLPKDVKGVLAQVGKVGFNEVETFGYSPKNGFFGTSVKDFKSMLCDNGLKATSNHFDFNGYIENGSTESLKSYIETANILGSEYVTVPYILQNLRGKSIDDYKKLALKINQAAEICKASGLKLAYHNHDFEFEKFESTTGYEILLNNTDKNLVDFEMDLYWVVRSGNNPLQLFKDHPGRFKMWHVKDMDKINPSFNAEIGTGSIDFKAIFAEAELSGMKRFFLEHESNYKPNPIESAAISYNYIKNNLI
ncbi:sugar phosphate isomerase/epimerase family protein [Flavobacterium gawalongense]|uniref:Sugar phosphate isomerase/epimerase n=1 Tax=Flavobacterium gawalongense TaxID=2594432 RepID=A0A553BGG8_9FLAO|nr:sugar phosphate isomerase/epimerase [Flavobacterium gawalongense]TRX00024.1 sugar phosphate isomerase/epimerase [Flavobacterium gawalongense]TRX04746.1 sugar phosphate isomerase/epimerase [Flavobacterium gawalongense]TRX07332.1 sugar phosphate isomerase/epimerase [Flavobacterium gawalongense]TRX08349.1 sugar phosphate isomerase/epimerase [Flavobacterium gawalongense]TRX24462.1 sugar phosphate isomerase/epimerase [Flavobacterium gawalongense]